MNRFPGRKERPEGRAGQFFRNPAQRTGTRRERRSLRCQAVQGIFCVRHAGSEQPRKNHALWRFSTVKQNAEVCR